MAKVQLRSAADLLVQGRASISAIKKKAVVAVGEKVREIVKEQSGGQMEAKLDYIPDGFVVGEPKTSKDPEGKKVREVERKTKAYATANLRLSDKSFVKSVIDGAK
jgi:hypothetical protein